MLLNLLLLTSKLWEGCCCCCCARSADGVTSPARLRPHLPLVVLPARTFSHLLRIHLLRPEVVRTDLLPDAGLGTLGLMGWRVVCLQPFWPLNTLGFVLKKVCAVWTWHSWCHPTLLWMTDNVVILLLLLLLLLLLMLSILPNFLRVSPLFEVIAIVVHLLIVLLLMPTCSTVVVRFKLGPAVRLRGSTLLGHPVSRWFRLRISRRDTFTRPSLRRLLRREVHLLSPTVVHSFWFRGSICIKRLASLGFSRKSLLVQTKCPCLPTRGHIGGQRVAVL